MDVSKVSQRRCPYLFPLTSWGQNTKMKPSYSLSPRGFCRQQADISALWSSDFQQRRERAASLWEGSRQLPLLERTDLFRTLTCPDGSADSKKQHPHSLLSWLKCQPGIYVFAPRQMPVMGCWERDSGPYLIDKAAEQGASVACLMKRPLCFYCIYLILECRL